MRQLRYTRTLAALAAVAVTLAGMTACSFPADGGASKAATPSGAPGGFPVTVANCGSKITLDSPARRIVLVNSDSLPNLEALGAVDRVVAITSALQPGLYDDATYSALGSLRVLSTQKNATGGSIVSQESILGAEPDLVVAPENAVDRSALAAIGIPVYTPSAYCAKPGPELGKTATFDRVWDEVRALGALLGVSEKAESVIAAGKTNVSSPAPGAGTAAALYVSSGGSVLSPYGGQSMVTPVFAAAGLTNVYAGSNERVFDANVEDIVSRNPGTIVLLYSSGDPQTTIDSFLSSPGASGLSAVQARRVVALQFPYTDPPSLLSIKGPAKLNRLLAALP